MWNYRIVRHTGKHGNWYAIHEVFYSDSGKPCLVTQEPIEPAGESKSDVVGVLKMMIRDAWRYRHEILNFEDFTDDLADEYLDA